ncbi:MAG: acyltransferase family protein [Candidatus Binatia bacterium]
MKTEPAEKDRSSFRPDIQGLRALAVLYVVLYHAKLPFFEGGYIGVDVFFVISGYLITGLLVRELEQKGRINFLTFYERRIRRLLPAAIVVLTTTVVATRILLSPLEQQELVRSVLFSALYASNLWFALETTDYLAGDVHLNPLLHTWSLSVEEQFYLLWPLLMLLGARIGSASECRKSLTITMGTVLLLSLGLALWVIEISPPWAFFGSPMRAWEFAVGGLAFMGNAYFAKFPLLVKDALALVGFAAIILAGVLFNEHTHFPGVAVLVPVLGTMLVIIASVGNPGRVVRCLDIPVVQTIGDLSYSWYLWHWPVLVFLAVTVTPLNLVERLGGVLFSLVLAWLTYNLIENRVRFSPLVTAVPLRSLALGICLTLIGAGSAVALRTVAKSSLNAPNQAEYAHAHRDLPKVYRDGCHASYSQEEIGECAYGDITAGRTMVLFGDSHSAQWFPALEKIALEQGWRLVSLTKSACPSAAVTSHVLGREYKECQHWRTRVLQRIREEHPALVVLANWSGYVKESTQDRDVTAGEWQKGMHQTLASLQQTGASIIVLRDTPWPGFNVPTCLSRASWWSQDISSCNFDRREALDSVVFELDRKAVAGLDKVDLVDISDLVCTGAQCQAVIGGQIAYRDDQHLTTTVSASFASVLANQFRQANADETRSNQKTLVQATTSLNTK